MNGVHGGLRSATSTAFAACSRLSPACDAQNRRKTPWRLAGDIHNIATRRTAAYTALRGFERFEQAARSAASLENEEGAVRAD